MLTGKSKSLLALKGGRSSQAENSRNMYDLLQHHHYCHYHHQCGSCLSVAWEDQNVHRVTLLTGRTIPKEPHIQLIPQLRKQSLDDFRA